jgi:hypothetical protein
MTFAANLAQSASNNQTMRNRIINGAMTISQRNGTSSVTPTDGQYTLDRWVTYLTQASKFTVQQDAGAVTPPAGFTDYLGVTSTSAYSVVSGDVFLLSQIIEGFNIADLGWGTANAQPVTLSFWVRSSLTGTFGGSIRNAAGNQNYPFSYTVSSANTWTSISVTIPAPTTGSSWNTTNGQGMFVVFSLGSGSTFSGTAGAWSTSNFYSATGATSVVGTNGATFYITGVQLEEGTAASPFEYRLYTTELQLCQRYFEIITAFEGSTIASGQVGRLVYTYRVTKRAAPTVTLGTSSVGTISVSAVDGCQLGSASAGAGPYFGDGNARANSEL